ncbi:MAG: amino acid ABC transporter permease [Actinomycetaceae bacterium]|nr:amino acid ABC transporter permease [Actinomycetaceae bacterium]
MRAHDNENDVDKSLDAERELPSPSEGNEASATTDDAHRDGGNHDPGLVERTEDGAPRLIHARPIPHPGRWLAAFILGVLAAMGAHGLITNENFHWEVVAENIFAPNIFQAIGWTLILTVAAMAIGITMAVTMAIMRRSANPIMRYVAIVYIWFFRGTPIYTQLIFWGLIGVLYRELSLGVPFGPEFFTFRTYDLFTPAVAAILGLGLNEGAYLSEIVRSGLDSVDKGQEEAAQALGMSPGLILRRIVLPQAMRVIVPPTGNQTISMLKTTSLVTAVPFTLELTKVAKDLGESLLLPIPFLVVAAFWYLAITSILMVFQSRIEAYYGRGVTGKTRKLSRRSLARQRTGRQAAIDVASAVAHDNAAQPTP